MIPPPVLDILRIRILLLQIIKRNVPMKQSQILESTPFEPKLPPKSIFPRKISHKGKYTEQQVHPIHTLVCRVKGKKNAPASFPRGIGESGNCGNSSHRLRMSKAG